MFCILEMCKTPGIESPPSDPAPRRDVGSTDVELKEENDDVAARNRSVLNSTLQRGGLTSQAAG